MTTNSSSSSLLVYPSNKELAEGAANANTRAMLHDLARRDAQFPLEPELHGQECIQWTAQVMDVATFCHVAAEGFSTVRAAALGLVARHWDSLPQEFRASYRNDFYAFAIAHTGLARGTLENQIRAVETFIFQAVSPPAPVVKIPVRDEHKKVVKEGERVLTQEVVWDPIGVPLSKLILLTSRANSGSMEAKHWTMLADPGCSYEHLNADLYGPGGGSDDPPEEDKGIKYKMQGPFLVATERGQTTTLAEFDWTDYYADKDSLAHRAINRLCLILGIELEEKSILRERYRKENGDAGYTD